MSIITSLLALVGLATTATYTDLNVDEFEKLIAEEGVVILDVRTPEDFLQKMAAQKLDKEKQLRNDNTFSKA